MSFDRERLERWSEEDAYDFVVECLRDLLERKLSFHNNVSPFDLRATDLIEEFLRRQRITDQNEKLNVSSLIGGKLMSALWLLCTRGILRPSVAHIGSWKQAQDSIAGNGYSFTEQGKKWLLEGEHNVLAIASQSFAKIVSKYADRFGESFNRRATDAIRCYDAGAYLACCAMCGAACESIYLAIAIEKTGDESKILKKYKASDGRKQLKNLIEYGQPGGLMRSLNSGFTVLSYWRDISAHGEETTIDREEARSALNTLLDLCQIGTDRWTDLTVANGTIVSGSTDTEN